MVAENAPKHGIDSFPIRNFDGGCGQFDFLCHAHFLLWLVDGFTVAENEMAVAVHDGHILLM